MSSFSFRDFRKYIGVGLLLVGVVAWSVWMYELKVSVLEKGYLTSDLAMYMNMLSNTDIPGGRLLITEMTRVRTGHPSFLAEHFAPTFILVAPIYQLFPVPQLLLGLQVVSQALAGILIYLIARARGLSLPAVLFCVAAYLGSENIIRATHDHIYGFHTDSMISPLLLGVILSWHYRKMILFVLCLVLVCGLKASVPFTVFAFFALSIFFTLNGFIAREDAGWIQFIGRRLREDPFIWVGCAIPVLFAIMAIFIAPRIFEASSPHSTGALKNLATQVASGAVFVGFPGYLISLPGHIPAFFLGLFSPAGLATLPELLLHYLYDLSFVDWHGFLALPLLSVGTVMVLGRIQRWMQDGRRGVGRVYRVLLIVLALLLVGYARLYTREGVHLLNNTPPQIDIPEMRSLVPTIPENAHVSGTSDTILFFANRPNLATPATPDLEYLILNLAIHRPQETDKELLGDYEAGRLGEYRLVQRTESNIHVLKRERE